MSVLGPSLYATIASNEIHSCCSAWCDYLQQHIHSEGRISKKYAIDWGSPQLEGAKFIWLANKLNEPWLKLIEVETAEPVNPFDYSGWFSLEVCVENVDELFVTLKDSPFKIIGEPADLDVSPDIRAMQVIGPAGEVLYLTQIKGPVAGFELPIARCPVDKLFIPVLLTENRDKTLSVFEQFTDTKGMQFETKITVINKAKQLPIDQRHPVATIQLQGNNLIEIDQITGLKQKNDYGSNLPAGISMISFLLDEDAFVKIDDHTYQYDDPALGKYTASLIEGYNGELIELIRR